VSRWAWAEIDLGAVRHNIETISAIVGPAAVWAVVKADGYGHGAEQVAAAARWGGAAGLCVALVKEGLALRDAGFDCPILVLSEQPPDDLGEAIRAGLELTVYSYQQLQAIAAAGGRDHPVHLKIDTGMRRVGADAEDALSLTQAITESPATRLAGLCTHMAVADQPDDPFNGEQTELFGRVLLTLTLAGHQPAIVHAANSAAALAIPAPRDLAGPDFWSHIARLFDHLLALTEQPGWAIDLWRLFYLPDAPATPDSALAAVLTAMTAWLDEALAAGRASGAVRDDLPPSLQAALAVAVLRAMDEWSLQHLEELDEAARARLASVQLDAFRRLLAP